AVPYKYSRLADYEVQLANASDAFGHSAVSSQVTGHDQNVLELTRAARGVKTIHEACQLDEPNAARISDALRDGRRVTGIAALQIHATANHGAGYYYVWYDSQAAAVADLDQHPHPIGYFWGKDGIVRHVEPSYVESIRQAIDDLRQNPVSKRVERIDFQ